MDIKCVVCGEPWDYYHLRHDAPPWVWKLFQAGAGCEGCEGDPKCQKCGTPKSEHVEHGHCDHSPEEHERMGWSCDTWPLERCGRCHEFQGWQPTKVDDVENGDLDPGLCLSAWEDFLAGKAPKWERPEPKVVWECDGCHVQVVTNPDFDPKKAPDLAYEYDGPKGGDCTNKWHRHRTGRYVGLEWVGEAPPLEPAHVFDAESNSPHRVCDECLDSCNECGAAISNTVEDPDAEGYCYPDPGGRTGICRACEEVRCDGCERYRHEDDDQCTCLKDVLHDVVRKHDLDLDDDFDEDQLHAAVDAQMCRRGFATSGSELTEEEVEAALVDLGVLVYEEEEEVTT